ncbi:MAG: CPBP family intramembrane metalloprotease [Clostridia bacterium]|nr:CPBP family intramembrane metalloprotease [Clostridia bacterium]
MKLTAKNLLFAGYFATMLTLTLIRVLFALDIFEVETSSLFSVLAQFVAMGIVPITFTILSSSRQRDRGYFASTMRIGERTPIKIWIAVVVLGIAQLMLNGISSNVWQSMLDVIGFTKPHSIPNTYSTTSALIVGILLTGILPAIFEEITHRGMLMSAVGRESSLSTILISALAFALMHQNIVQQAHTFVGGVIFGMVALYTGNILCAMLLHAMNNIYVVLTTHATYNGGIMADIQKFFVDLYFGGEAWVRVLLTALVVSATVVAGVYIYKHRVPTTPTTPMSSVDKVFFSSALILGLGGVVMTLVAGLLR